MNHDYKSLLDRRREGQEFSLTDINRALRDAGDLAPDRGTGLDSQIPQQTAGTGETGSPIVVGDCEAGYQETAWAGWSRYLDCIDGETA